MAFGVPVEVANDGGPEYNSHEFGKFLERWGVKLRMSSAYHAQSNGRAEVAVKTVKRALRDHTGEDGRLDQDTFARALLLLRNTPDRDTGTSPAELLFGRRLRDTLPQPYVRRQSLISNNSPVDKRWLATWSERESALRTRAGEMIDKIDARAHNLAPLMVGDRVRVQNQAGTAKTRWSRTGTVMEINNEFDQYLIRMDGSRRTTARNRQFLRKIRADPEARHQAETKAAPMRPATVTVPGPATVAGTPPRDGAGAGNRAPGTPPNNGPAGRTTPSTPRRATGIPLRESAARRITFGDDRRMADEVQPMEPDIPAQPDTPAPAPQLPPPARPGQAGGEAPSGRPSRTRKPPVWSTDYEMTEMSEIRQPSSYMVEEVDVGGMLDNDIPGTAETRLRESTRETDPSRTCADASSGRDIPGSDEKKTTCVRSVLIGMKDLCRKNGISEVFATYLVGRLAIELCHSDPPI